MGYKADRYAITRQRQLARIQDREWQQYQRKMIVVSDGWANESSGNVEAPTGHFARISNSPAELAEVLEAFEETTSVYGVPDAEDMTGHFLVISDSLGFIHIVTYASEAELINAYRALESEYDEWASEDGED